MIDTMPQRLLEAHSERVLFELRPVRALQRARLTEDMTDALADPDVVGYAPGVLSIVCEWMDLNQTHTFVVQASSSRSYALSLSSSLLQFLEQLPQLLQWEAQICHYNFLIDFNEQGSDLRIELAKEAGRIRHSCIEDHWQSASRVDGDWESSAESFRCSCNTIAQEIVHVAALMNAGIVKFPAFRDWSGKCGLTG